MKTFLFAVLFMLIGVLHGSNPAFDEVNQKELLRFLTQRNDINGSVVDVFKRVDSHNWEYVQTLKAEDSVEKVSVIEFPLKSLNVNGGSSVEPLDAVWMTGFLLISILSLFEL